MTVRVCVCVCVCLSLCVCVCEGGGGGRGGCVGMCESLCGRFGVSRRISGS